MKYYTASKYKIAFLILFFILIVMSITSNVSGQESKVYADGIYRYRISSESKKEVYLIGFELSDQINELRIPGKVFINNIEYTVSKVVLEYLYNDYYENIKKIIVDENYHGDIIIQDRFVNAKCFEFKGEKPPKAISITIGEWMLWYEVDNLDITFIVPKGREELYKEKIDFSMAYGDDAIIEIEPVVISSNKDKIEHQALFERWATMSGDSICFHWKW